VESAGPADGKCTQHLRI